MILTADHVAWAIVAACRETGDDPFDCACGKMRPSGPGRHGALRGRHYALHALVEVFPEHDKFELARMVGAPGNSRAFWHHSWNQVAKPASSGRRMVNWWDDGAFARVILAIRAVPEHRFGLVAEISLHRDPVPIERCADMTAEFFGDPPPGRSALAQRKAVAVVAEEP